MKKVLLGTVLVLLLAGCGETVQVNVPVTVPVKETVEVKVDVPVPITVEVPVTVQVDVPVTKLVVVTPTPEPTPEERKEQGIAANYVMTQEQGGIEITLVRVLCGDAAYWKETNPALDSDQFANSITVCEFVLEVVNNSDIVLTVYPDQGEVIIGDEQVEPWDFFASIDSLEDISDDYQPGVKRVGGFWLGLRRTKWDEITQIIYTVGSPIDEEWDRHGEDWYFKISTEGWGFEAVPDL
ncbi:MAG: hypothetical protein JXA37_11360 [Chloroflexia bacterium]|nr:hypothetical protein [Chloroflexia bacterium]